VLNLVKHLHKLVLWYCWSARCVQLPKPFR